LKLGTAAFLPGALYAEALQETHPQHKTNQVKRNQTLYKTQPWRCKTTVVEKGHRQTPYKQKNIWPSRTGGDGG